MATSILVKKALCIQLHKKKRSLILDLVNFQYCKNELKKIAKSIVIKGKYFLHLQHIRLSKKLKFFIFITPNHLNIGDLAILEAEKRFIKKYFPEYEIECFDSDEVSVLDKTITKYVNENDIVTIHGGGFLGTLWFGEELYFRNIIKIFNDRKIVVFPQTIYFDNNSFGIQELINSKKIYKSNHRLILCTREEYSYKFVKENIGINTYLIPDMVLFLSNIFTQVNKSQKNKRVILCLRSDAEKTTEYRDVVIDCLKELGIGYNTTDMVINSSLRRNRKKLVFNKIQEFSGYSLVITDRLHGMVLSYLAGTSCIVLPSKSYKIKGVYNWIQECSNIRYLDNIDILKEEIASMINTVTIDKKLNIDKYYDILAKVIRYE